MTDCHDEDDDISDGPDLDDDMKVVARRPSLKAQLRSRLQETIAAARDWRRPARHRANGARRPGRLLTAFVGVAVVLAGWSLYQSTMTASRHADELADPVLEICARGGDVARSLAADGKCALAEEVNNSAPDNGSTNDDDDGEVINRAEVARLVQAEVAKITLPEGHGPTSGQLIAAARQVVNENPELFRGPPGEDVTDARIAAAVNAYFEANPPPAGKDGTDGKDGTNGSDGKDGRDGRSVVSSGPVRDDNGACVFRTTYREPDGTTTTEDFPTRELNCPLIDAGP